MPFINAASRKRRQSSTAKRSPTRREPSPRPSKLPKLNHLLYDGTSSRSMESTSTGRSKASVKTQLKRGVSSIKTILGLGGRNNDTNLPHQTVFTSTQGSQLGYILHNDSDATTLYHPLTIRLTGMNDVAGTNAYDTPLSTVKSAPMSPVPQETDEDTMEAAEWGANHDRRGIRRSQSVPGLQRLISQKFHQTFGNPTVVKRSELRSRPSVQALVQEAVEAASVLQSSTPSTLNSSWASPTDRRSSTPLTSMPVTPTSIARSQSMNPFDLDRQTYLAESRILTPIPESTVTPSLTIKTVEAAAAAKLFFELHFNSLLNDTPSRAIRCRELETKLREHHFPASSQHRARKAWERAESELLRQIRVLKNTTNLARASEGVHIGGFEVISVLGKGSFGVVRLVKGKAENAKGETEIITTEKRPESKQSRASLKSSPPRWPGPLPNKRRDLAKGKEKVFAMKVIRKSEMIRNAQEGHLRAERDFLAAAEGSRWIIPLIAAFQDQKHLYLVMEYCIGGDFLGLLIRKNVLSEEATKWYIAEMILCVEEAHRMGWIHRDVKPDNFLIAIDGHLKISDFGLAFDGDWCHDQKFYQKSRNSLLEQLGIEIEGDEQDKQEKQVQLEQSTDNALFPLQKTGKHDKSESKDEPSVGEPILDWRNRAQCRRLARSVVGTSQYMAPEVIRGEMYDGRCDW